MKESGIDWIGQIPEEWGVRPIKHIVETPVTDGPHETPVLYETGIPFLSAEAVKDGVLDFNYKRGYISLKDHDRFKKKISPKKDDIFIVKSGATTGNVGIVNTDEIFDIWSPLALIRCNKTLAIQKYIYFYLLSTLFKSQVEFNWSFGTQQNIGMGVIERIKVILPPVPEQQQIVEILDKKTAQLDKVKSLLEEQIQKLKDYRSSLIYETVTKGLDKTVPLKNSGIDWIGQVPEGWEIVKFKYLFNTSKGLSITKECLVDEGIPVINYGQIHSSMTKQVRSCDVRLPFVPDYYLSKKGVNLNQGDFVFADTSEDLEGAGNFSTRLDSTGQLLAGYHTIIVRLNDYDEHNFRYFMHLFDSLAIRKQIQNKVSGVKVYSVTQGILNSIFVITPPKNEQQKIANLLDKRTAQIDNLIQIKNQQIENINKQRQTLIYDYVTGKRRA